MRLNTPGLRRHGQMPVILIAFAICLAQTGCGGCTTTRQSVPAEISVKISDPTFQRLAAITGHVEIEAEGKLKAGRYSFRNFPLEIPANASFTIALNLPVTNSTNISTGQANGQLTTTKTLFVAGVQMPQTLSIESGKASADVDLGRTIAAFLLQLLQQKESETATSNVKDLLDDLVIKKATFVLKSGQLLEMKTLQGEIGDKSVVAFENIQCDEQLNYTGLCRANLNLKNFVCRSGADSGSKNHHALPEPNTGEPRRQTEQPGGVAKVKRKTESDGGTDPITKNTSPAETERQNSALEIKAASASIAMTFTAQRLRDILTMRWNPDTKTDSPSRIELSKFQCTLHNGIIAGDKCTLQIANCKVTKHIDQEPVDFALNGDVHVERASLRSQTAGRNFSALLPEMTDARITMNRADSAEDFSIVTKEGIHARNVQWQIRRPESTIEFTFADAATGPVTISGTEGLTVVLQKGTVVPTRFSWQSHGRTVTASLQNSSMTLNRDVHFDLRESEGLQLDTLPLTVNASSIEVKSGEQELIFRKVKGNAAFKITGDRIDLHSALTVSVDTPQNPPGLQGVPLTIGGVDLTGSKTTMHATLRECRLILPCSRIVDTIKSELPAQRKFDIHKSILADRRWRYRNLSVDEVEIDHPSISNIKFSADNKVTVSGETDIKAIGTVERLQLSLTRFKGEWRQHPWSATGHINGAGQVSYKILPRKSLADSALEYELELKLQVPENLKVDWSQVAGDTLGKTEQALMGAVIKHAAHFAPDDGIPINQSGTIALFPHAQRQLKKVQLSTFKTQLCKDNLFIIFSAEASL